ncbi:MAG: isoleucine--tRNA ligase [Rickettsiales bacterium]|jgi:isoleucyl-tRNA synthetase|nr:isoleucine--tRNA ligase [Rickettsiales bacterium]
MSYPKTEPKADFPKLEQEVLLSWREDDTFHKTLNATAGGKSFTIYDGPPFANALPHWGHLSISSNKDCVCRYQTMKGRHVARQLGWDCHGMAAEGAVEKKQGKSAQDIVAAKGVGEFCKMCESLVMTYSNEWLGFFERLGRWTEGGGDKGYRTLDKNYMESVIWALKQLYDKGLLYRDFKVNPYDWKLGTVLSHAEASQDYRTIQDEAVSVWFELEDGRRMVAWTTTPWTLPANSALAVSRDLKYAQLKNSDGHTYIIAASRIKAYEKVFADAENIGEVAGADLVGLKYAPLFDFYKDKIDFAVVAADFVSDSDGTGIVHLAPAFGEDDYWAVKAIDPKFPVIVNVDDYGNFDKTVVGFAGMNIFDANPKIISALKEQGRLVKRESYSHQYPHGDRSKEKLIYRATEAWFVDVPKIKDRLIANNKKTNWTSAGERYAKWIEGVRPWGISRNRFWGTPLPIWTKGGEYKIFGSMAEIEEFFGVKIAGLHRDDLDGLEKDGWKRIPDVLDCWFESGSMPFASLHYPFENKDRFAAEFPADYIVEAQDQTRGWFYTLNVLATALFDKPAFKTVGVSGLVVDEHKKKLSKSVGNYSDPTETVEKYGADAVRLFMLGSNLMKTEPVSVDLHGTVFLEPIKTVLLPLWNAYHIFTLYANAANITAAEPNPKNDLDKYILSKLSDFEKSVRWSLDDYKSDIAVREAAKFMDTLNNWYVRLSRERFWNEDKSIFDCMHFVLKNFCKIIAPMAPFLSDYIYRNLTGEGSVHLARWPELSIKPDAELSRNMDKVRDIVSVGKMLRENAGLRNRLPLPKITIAGDMADGFDDIIKSELNVKSVAVSKDIASVADSFVYLLTPKIGARLGAGLKEIMAASKGPHFDPNAFGLLPEEYENRLTVRPGITGAALPDNTAVVVLDTNITPELQAEGLVNDALRFIQDSRKAAGLDVSDRITIEYSADDELAAAIETHRARVMEDALATKLERGKGGAYETEIEGRKFSIDIRK